jgi:tetrathionate reductase subunit B
MVPINPNTGKAPRWKMALDIERCIGCHACSVACKVENTVPLARFRTKVYYWDTGILANSQKQNASFFLPFACNAKIRLA